mgnify:CR=1 FL=1
MCNRAGVPRFQCVNTATACNKLCKMASDAPHRLCLPAMRMQTSDPTPVLAPPGLCLTGDGETPHPTLASRVCTPVTRRLRTRTARRPRSGSAAVWTARPARQCALTTGRRTTSPNSWTSAWSAARRRRRRPRAARTRQAARRTSSRGLGGEKWPWGVPKFTACQRLTASSGRWVGVVGNGRQAGPVCGNGLQWRSGW